MTTPFQVGNITIESIDGNKKEIHFTAHGIVLGCGVVDRMDQVMKYLVTEGIIEAGHWGIRLQARNPHTN